MTLDQRPFRDLCPEADRRDAMDDGEFWDTVAQNILGNHYPDTDDDFDPPEVTAQLGPCPECGEMGACAYDDEGRALVHVVPDEDAS